MYLFHDTQLNLNNYCFCKQGASISVKSKTNSGFGELAGGFLKIIRIGDTDTIVRFCKCFCTWHIMLTFDHPLAHPPDGEGFHLFNDTFTVSDIRGSPRPLLLLISSLVIVGEDIPTPGKFKVCELDEDGATYIDSTHFQVSTLTGICNSFGFGWLNVGGLQLGRETPVNEMYVIVVSSLPCGNITTELEDFTTPHITIMNDGT